MGVTLALLGFGLLALLGHFVINPRIEAKRREEEAAKDPYWKQFRHAYGDASDLPALFDRMRAGDPTVWNELWPRLCHQGRAFSDGSVAAVPVLVDYAASVEPLEREEALGLAAAICTDVPSIPMRQELAQPFAAAVSKMRELARQSLGEASGEQPVLTFVSALAVSEGLPIVEKWSSYIDDGELTLDCPHCEGALLLRTDCEPWVVVLGDDDGPTIPIEPPAGFTEDDLDRYVTLARERGAERAAHWIEQLRTAFACPHCGERSTVRQLLELS